MNAKTYRVRRVGSIDDVRSSFAAIGAAFSPAIPPDDWRLDRLIEGLAEGEPLMIVAEQDGDIVGGVLGRVHDGSAGVHIVGFAESVRGTGLARRVMQTIEVEAMALGARQITLGSVRAARGFYEALGYAGKRTGKLKSLPLPGRVRDLRVAKLQAKIGDLDEGQLVEADPQTGAVPALW